MKWSRDTGHIGIHRGVDGRIRSYGLTVTKTKFSRIDGLLPYFLNYDAPRARAFGTRGALLQQQYVNITLRAFKYLKGRGI